MKRAGLSTPMNQLADRISQHSARLKELISRRCGSAILAITTVEDIYQETIAEMMVSASTVGNQQPGRFFSWATTIARRVILRKLHAAGRGCRTRPIRPGGSTDDGISESAIRSPRRSPSSSAAGHEATDRLYKAIQELPTHYQDVITLYKLEERSLTEVSGKLRRSKGATCRLLARAQSALSKRLEE